MKMVVSLALFSAGLVIGLLQDTQKIPEIDVAIDLDEASGKLNRVYSFYLSHGKQVLHGPYSEYQWHGDLHAAQTEYYNRGEKTGRTSSERIYK